MRRAGRVLVIVMVTVFVVGSVVGVGGAALSRAIARSKTTSCANNLAQLWKTIQNYRVQFG